jgi:hypothetical protein
MSFPPINELKDVFESSESCINFLFIHNILYQTMECPKHKRKMSKGKKVWRCTKLYCNKEISLLYQSFFADSKIDPNKVMLIMYLKLANTLSTSIQMITGHSSATVSKVLAKFRNLVTEDVKDRVEIIGGDGIEVEIDETLISKKKNPWTLKNGIWVFGGVERTTQRRFFAEVAPDRKHNTLFEVIKRNIHPGSIIISDCWSSYRTINKVLRMDHMTIDHSKNFRDPDTGAHTNTIEGTWHGLKLKIPNLERKVEKLDEYIFEFIWRRQNENNLWNALLQCLAKTFYY